ncbi:MAG: T9SS type A sorting domain-containing protein [Sphingobacteriaceae bacterium]|nr:T9SS type A sorting domain-containing protein [Sphingobacteriaceae bacterium]
MHGQAVSFQPFQYNPVTKTLRVYTELTVRVYNQNASKTSALALPEHVDANFLTIYQSQFLNASSLPVTTPLAEGGKMLIICNDAYMSAMTPFIEWKKKIGIPTTMVSISSVGNNTALILNYVTNYYNTNGLSYLLLVGDAQHITPITFAMSGDSDNGYGYIVGNDRYPDIMVGRFSAETATHVTTMVNRTIAYEKTPTPNASWYKNAMGIASDQGPGNDNQIDYQHMRSIRGQLLAYTYTNVAEMYDGSQGVVDATGNPSAAMVAAELNAGVSLINYVGHGSDNSWASSGFSSTNINALNNNNKWPFIFSVACVNGNFKNQTCFAETWLRAANASGPTGAVATIMSTINQYWNQPMEGQDMMDTILCEAISNNIKRSFGGITVNGMYKMNDFYGTSGMDMTDTWTIFGDPSVIVRSDNPTPMTVTHSTLEVVGVTQLAVNCNKNGAIVCLTKQGNILGTGIVASGSVNITFPAINSIDSIDVTVTAYNCVPYFGKTYVQCPANLMTLNSNNVSICIGSSATLSASGATSYTWNTSSNAASIVVNPMANAQYTVTGTLNNVCYESEVVNVTVNQLPNVTFNQNPTTVCLGSGLVPFNGLPAGGVYAGNGVVGSNFNVGTAGTGSHQIVYTYTDINGCVNTATATMLVDPCASLNENVLAHNISIYPVPATDHIVIKFASTHDGMQVSIYNAIGQVVSQKAIAKGIQNYKLETSEYARGVYFLKVKTNEQIKFVKFVLE